MENLNQEQEVQYNDIPVEYCTHCLSIAIMDADGTPYCNECGSTDIREAHIFEWEKIYEAKYGTKYLNK